MDNFFQDSFENPLPPDEVRIRELRAEPWPDGRRVRITLEVDPFQKRPSAEVVITDSEDVAVAQASVIESTATKIEFTMHLRQAQTAGRYTVSAILYYSEPIPEPSRRENESETPSPSPEAMPLPEIKTVDKAETTFSVEVS
jgi:hypothetical protein